MKATIVKIGNSRGIRIPKPLFAACGFKNEVEIEVKDNRLIIQAPHRPREGWNEAFQAMARQEDDSLVDPVAESKWDTEEWEWK